MGLFCPAGQKRPTNVLALPLVPAEQVVGTNDVARLTGSYWYGQGETEQTCAVVLEDRRLRIRSAQPQAVGFFFAGPARELIAIDTHTFYAGISPVLITFVEDARNLAVDSAAPAALAQRAGALHKPIVGREELVWPLEVGHAAGLKDLDLPVRARGDPVRAGIVGEIAAHAVG